MRSFLRANPPQKKNTIGLHCLILPIWVIFIQCIAERNCLTKKTCLCLSGPLAPQKNVRRSFKLGTYLPFNRYRSIAPRSQPPTPRKINGWNLTITQLKRKIIIQTSIFRFQPLIFQGVFRQGKRNEARSPSFHPFVR